MRKNCERFVAALLSASMLLGICMPGAMAVTAEEEDQTNYVEVLPVTYEAPEDDETPRLDVKVDNEGNVDAEVVGRPETTPEEPDVEWDLDKKLEGEDAEELGKDEIKADAEGSETYTPSETVKDGEDRVTEEGGETKGEETVETEVTEKPKHETVTSPEIKSDVIPGSTPAESQPEDGKDDQTPGEPTEGDETTGQPEGGDQTDGSESTTETTDKPTAGADLVVDKETGKPELDNEGNLKYDNKEDTWNLTEDDLRDLVTKPEAPEGWQTAEDGNSSKSSSTVTAEDGTVTETEKNWKREEYKDKTKDGQLIAGYKETTVETVREDGKTAPDMSDRPENAKDVTSADGLTGYSYTEVTWTSEGARVETTYTVYPEQGTYTKTTETTTTKLIYAKQEKEGSVEITDVTVTEGDSHGSLTGANGAGNVQGPQADPNKEPGNLQFGKDESGKETGLRDVITEGGKADGIGNNNFLWDTTGAVGDVGAWAGSIYEIKTTDEKNETGHPALYVVRSPKKDDKGNIIEGEYDEYYVYCADRGQALNGQGYNLENLKDSKYFDGEDWKKIQSIAVNGYWGVADDAEDNYGSLEAFKAMLQAQNPTYWNDETLAKLNDGMALTVTQAAIWKYASSHSNKTADGSTKENPDVVTQNPFFDTKVAPGVGNQGWAGGSESATDEQKLLYQAYLDLLARGQEQLKENEKTATDLIDAEDITNIQVTINGKEKDEDVYDTDLSFTMAVQPDRMKADDLIVTVKVGNESYTYRLEGAAQGDERTDVKVNKTENDITYVLKGIKMPDGTEVSINLSGTQSLGKSAYLLTAEGGYNTSQSFVGVFEGKREVNVNVNLTFNASQPTATVTADTTVETKVDQTKHISWADSWLKKIFYPKPEQPNEPDTPTTPEIPVEPETPTEPEITEKPDNTEEIVDAATPAPKIDSVPKTGDDASVWMVLCMLSAAGLAVLNLPKKKTEH